MSQPKVSPDGVAIVVGHHGRTDGDRVLAVAIDLAGRLGAQLHVVHSVTLEDYGVDPDTDGFEQRRDRNVAAERDAITSALAGTGLDWTYHEEHGDPSVCLAKLADDVDALFIVVGATHHRLLGRVSSAAVSKHLLHQQHRPVLVVPTH